MERMTRNGLLTLVAVLLALALVVRMENAALAQVPGQITYYDHFELIIIDPLVPPQPREFALGNRVTISRHVDGRTLIVQNPFLYPPILDSDALGRQTNNQEGTVFLNIGGPSYIAAANAGTVISSVERFNPSTGLLETSPAIINGMDSTAVVEIEREYVVRIEQVGDRYRIIYGYRYANDPPDMFRSVLDYNELPEEIRALAYPPGSAFAGTLLFDESNTVILPPNYEPDLAPGDYSYLQAFSITGPRVTPPLEPPTVSIGVPGGESLYDPAVLPPVIRSEGEYLAATLIINGPTGPRFFGDDRTLIQSAGHAIENHGIIEIYDSRIEAVTAGILNEYARSVDFDDDGEPTGYGPTEIGHVTLHNTQIGRPGGQTLYFNSTTGTQILDITGWTTGYDTVDAGIKVDAVFGTPIRTVTEILAGQKIMADGVNGRITAGQTVTMTRNPIGQILSWGNNVEAQRTIYDIFAIDGPDIGIHARVFSPNSNRNEAVATNEGWYEGATIVRGDISTSVVENHIDLLDNSWIFAGTGISFGNSGTSLGNGAIRITVDSTSGIYATGRNTHVGIVRNDTENNPASANYGITDRYSLVNLVQDSGDLTTGYGPWFTGYSGSFHEIQVDGKVIVGAPSRAGVVFNFDYDRLTTAERERLGNVYYYDPNDPDRDGYGNVYYYRYDPSLSASENAERNARVAEKFVAYNDQPNRVFWLRTAETPVQLTHYDYATQRWTVHPDAANAALPTGAFAGPRSYFAAFDNSYGVGVFMSGTSIGFVNGTSVYYGPTVRSITAVGNDALIAGGTLGHRKFEDDFGGVAIRIGHHTHVAQITVGSNMDMRNLSDVLFVGSTGSHSVTPTLDFELSAMNFRAFDMMTSIKRTKFLYDPTLLFSDNSDRFHFDNAGIHGDIITDYNAVAFFVGNGSGGEWTWDATLGGGGWVPGTGYGISGWVRMPWDMGYDSIVTATDDGPSALLGHRDDYGSGRSLILDEILLNFLAGNMFRSAEVAASYDDSYGYANDWRHYREALARFVHLGSLGYSNYSQTYDAEFDSGLSISELLEGYTRDGILVTFTSGDIFSGNIYGGGYGDEVGPSMLLYGSDLFGNIDVRIKHGTVLFNRNIVEYVDDSNIYRDPGIRVRDVYVEKTGHLLLNDSWFAVNPFTWHTGAGDYAQRLIIHDVLNEGIVSGNGVFQIAQRRNYNYAVPIDYFEGYFINRGVLAPGLPGFIGENVFQAINLEQTAYGDMLSNFTQDALSVDWDMRGVPGGQFGVITVFGSLRLMDEHIRPIYDPTHLLFNTDEILAASEYHVTIGNDSIRDVFSKYVAAIDAAPASYVKETRFDNTPAYVYQEIPEGQISQEDLKIIVAEKLGTHLSWFSPSAMIDRKNGLPLLTEYEQFEYLTNAERRVQLQRQMVETVLTADELRQYNANPVQRALLNQRLLEENNIRFELTQLDELLMRFGFSDVVSVHGTTPAYWYNRSGWGNALYDLGSVPPSAFQEGGLLGITQLGGVIQADRIFDLDPNADTKEKQTSFIVIASEAYTDGTVKKVTSATTDWVYANVSVLPVQMASGQYATVLTVIDDPNYYRNRVRAASRDNYNAQSVAGALDDAMFTNPGLAQSFNFGVNSPETLNNVFRQVAGATRSNSLAMNVLTPSEHLFSRIGYGVGGMSTGRRGDIVFHNIQTGRLQQPYGRPAVPPPGHQFAPPMAGQMRGQSPAYRTGSVWGAYTHSNFAMADDGNSFKYNYYRNGAMVGSEWNLSPNAVIGGVVMVNDSTLKSWNDKVNSQDYVFGLYFVTAPFDQFEIRSFLGTGVQSYKSDRYIRNSDVFIGLGGSMNGVNDVFGINEHYESETRGHSFNYALEFARPFTVNPNFVIRPTAGFEYQGMHQKGYTEQLRQGTAASWTNNSSNIAQGCEAEGVTSGSYAMRYRNLNFGRFLLRAGFSTESYFARGGVQLRAYHILRMAGDRFPISTQSFVSGSRDFQVRGGEFGYNQWQLGAGTHFWLNQDRTATLFLDGDWNFSPFKAGYSGLNLSVGSQFSF